MATSTSIARANLATNDNNALNAIRNALGSSKPPSWTSDDSDAMIWKCHTDGPGVWKGIKCTPGVSSQEVLEIDLTVAGVSLDGSAFTSANGTLSSAVLSLSKLTNLKLVLANNPAIYFDP